MGKRQDQAQRTKTRIMEAAERLIRMNGSATVDQIVAAAGVSKGSFYTYFPHKEDIVNALAQQAFEQLQEELVHMEGDVWRQLKHFLTESMRYICQMGISMCQEWVKIAADPAQGAGLQKLTNDSRRIEAILEAGVCAGELRRDTPVDALTERIVAQYYGTVFCWSIRNGEMDACAQLEGYCETELRDSLSNWHM